MLSQMQPGLWRRHSDFTLLRQKAQELLIVIVETWGNYLFCLKRDVEGHLLPSLLDLMGSAFTCSKSLYALFHLTVALLQVYILEYYSLFKIITAFACISSLIYSDIFRHSPYNRHHSLGFGSSCHAVSPLWLWCSEESPVPLSIWCVSTKGWCRDNVGKGEQISELS